MSHSWRIDTKEKEPHTTATWARFYQQPEWAWKWILPWASRSEPAQATPWFQACEGLSSECGEVHTNFCPIKQRNNEWILKCSVRICYAVVANIGEGAGSPLQYSCLDNPMDGGAWWAAVHGVAKSQTWLSDCTFTFHFHALEKETATHSSILAWIIPWTEEPGGLQSTGLQRVGHNWATSLSLHSNCTVFQCDSEEPKLRYVRLAGSWVIHTNSLFTKACKIQVTVISQI